MVVLLLAMVLATQDDAAATEAITTFEAAFAKSKDSSTRAGAVSTLARTQHEKVVGRLGSLLTNEDKAVRTAAVQGLASFSTASVELKKSASHALAGCLTAGINVKDPDFEQGVFSAIGSLQDESAGSTLKSHFEDRDPKIAGAAVSAAGALKSKAMIEPLIELLKECERTAKSGNTSTPAPTGKKAPPAPKTPKGGGGGSGGSAPDPEAAKRDRANNLIPTIQQALQALTGQSLAAGDDWERWWSKNRSTFTITK